MKAKGPMAAMLLLAVFCGFFPAIRSSAQQGSASSGSTQAIDSLTAPIALYPDALIAQILVAATKPEDVKKFSQWLSGSTLKGSELQSAAETAGFDACYIALATFPDVVQMLAQKIDWTQKLGAAFLANKEAVFSSIQDLRSKAMAVGNLKTTPQQEVKTETTSSGDQVIVIQPSNPQVVYVPQYNPQTVYVTAPPAAPATGASVAGAAAVGFTMGVIIGAASNNYYHGPYAWHGAAMYEEAWEDRYDYLEDRQENRLDYMEDRQESAHENQAQRQSASQENQAQRQTSREGNQAERETSRQENQTQRQATSQERQSAQPQASASNTRTQPQATPSTRQPQAGTTPSQSGMQSQRGQKQTAAATSSKDSWQSASQRSGTRSGGFSGYQNGSTTRSQSQRGNGSLSSSRGGNSRRR